MIDPMLEQCRHLLADRDARLSIEWPHSESMSNRWLRPKHTMPALNSQFLFPSDLVGFACQKSRNQRWSRSSSLDSTEDRSEHRWCIRDNRELVADKPGKLYR
jgi:hypothetical protein